MKLSLIIDGNYLLQKSVFILYKLRSLYTDLPIILEKDFNTITNLYYFSNIYFISDSRRNWRKSFYDNYKGSRKKNENIDWDTVYEIFNKFKYSLKGKKNCHVYQIDNLEGDDLIAYIINKTNRHGYSNLIIGNDSDLFQMINFDQVGKYINFMYNFKFNDERIFIPKSYEIFLESLDDSENLDDLFGGNQNTDAEFLEFFNGLLKSKKVSEIDSEQELFIKIVGHNKDNIKSIYMKGTRGIGKVGAENLYNLYKETYPDNIDFNSSIFKERLIDIIKLYKRIKTDELDKDMMDRINLNLKLVKLDKRSTPTNLYEKMEESIDFPFD
jgi:hypothetical protein